MGVGFVELDAEQGALVRVHGGLEELFGVHFTQTFEALDLHAAFADLHDLVEDAGNTEHGVDLRIVAIAFDNFEERLVLAAEVIDVQTKLIELLEAGLHAVGLVNFDQTSAASLFRRGGAVGGIDLRFTKEVQIMVVSGEIGQSVAI